MAYGTILSDTLQSSTAGVPPQFNDGGGTQVGTLCRAWVNFNGGSGSINASFNVSSITRTGTGAYQINLTNALLDANYSASVSASSNTGGTNNPAWCLDASAFNSINPASFVRTSSKLYLTTYNIGVTTNIDPVYVSVSFFR